MPHEAPAPRLKVYLGDSVYAQFNDYDQLVLTTENGLPSDPSNKIIFEPETYRALSLFLQNSEVRGW